MPLHLDLRVVELLASRLCHDLVSPVGAVNNGLELLAEDLSDTGAVSDAVRLAQGSGQQAAKLLQFYRLAYGQAGHRRASGGDEIFDLAYAYVRGHKSELIWPVDDRWADVLAGAQKLTLNLVALAVEVLPRGGTVTVALEAQAVPWPVVSAEGKDLRFDDTLKAALSLSCDPQNLTARTVQAHWTAWLASAVAGGLAAGAAGADSAVFRVLPPEPEPSTP